MALVDERRVRVNRSMNESPCGARTSANAGTSSVKAGEKPARRKTKVSWATLIVPGSVGT